MDGPRSDDAPPPTSRAAGSRPRAPGRRLLGPLSTALVGAGLVAFTASRSWWGGAAALAVVTVVMTAAEVWGARVGGDGPGWRPLRWAYGVTVVAASIGYALATGEEFYRVTFAAVVFVPAVVQAGRGIHARRHGRAAG